MKTGGQPPNGISETVSENQSAASVSAEACQKRRRGRPRKLEIPLQAVAIAIPNVKTHRQRMNLAYMLEAIGVPKDVQGTEWLLDSKNAACLDPPVGPAIRAGILSELGRIEDEEQLIHFARIICEAKPKTRPTVQILRRWRTGQLEDNAVANLPDSHNLSEAKPMLGEENEK